MLTLKRFVVDVLVSKKVILFPLSFFFFSIFFFLFQDKGRGGWRVRKGEDHVKWWKWNGSAVTRVLTAGRRRIQSAAWEAFLSPSLKIARDSGLFKTPKEAPGFRNCGDTEKP